MQQILLKLQKKGTDLQSTYDLGSELSCFQYDLKPENALKIIG